MLVIERPFLKLFLRKALIAMTKNKTSSLSSSMKFITNAFKTKSSKIFFSLSLSLDFSSRKFRTIFGVIKMSFY